jgi:hypothetical protein
MQAQADGASQHSKSELSNNNFAKVSATQAISITNKHVYKEQSEARSEAKREERKGT